MIFLSEISLITIMHLLRFIMLLIMMLSIITSCSNIFAIYLCYILDRKAARAPAVAPVIAPNTAAAARAVTAYNLGNECYNKSQYQGAIDHFTSAIGLDGTNYMYYSNRSDAYQQIKSWTNAAADARKVSITRSVTK